MEDEIIIPDTPSPKFKLGRCSGREGHAVTPVSTSSSSNWLSKHKKDYLNNQHDSAASSKEKDANGAKRKTSLKTLNVSPFKYESTLRKNPRLTDKKFTDNYNEFGGFVRSSTLISPTKLSIHSKNVPNRNIVERNEGCPHDLHRKRKRLVASKPSFGWPSPSDDSESDSNEFMNSLRSKYMKKKLADSEDNLSKKPSFEVKKKTCSKFKHKLSSNAKSAQNDNQFVADTNRNTINLDTNEDLVVGRKKSKTTAATSTITSAMSEACYEPSSLTKTPTKSDFPFPTEPDSGLDSRSDSPVFNIRPVRRAMQDRISQQSRDSSAGANIFECITVTPGSADNPIEVEQVSMTPNTVQIMNFMRDEELARKLQEQLDMEFAIALQNNQDESVSMATQEAASGFGPHFNYPTVVGQGDNTIVAGAVGGGWHMHSPVRAHARHRSRQRVSRANRYEATEELLHLVMETEAALRSGSRTSGRGTSTHTGSRRRRHPGFNIASPGPLQGNDYEDLMRLAEILGDVKEKGLSQVDSCRLPVVTYRKNGESTECNICMAEYEEGDLQKILPCFHAFHSACIDTWISKNATCPICRVEISLKSPTIT